MSSLIGLNPFGFLDKPYSAKDSCGIARFPCNSTAWAIVGEDFVILACVVFSQCQRVTDGRMDTLTTTASTGFCVARYTDAM